MKRTIWVTSVCVLALVLTLIAGTALAETMYVNTPNGGNVNLREGPGSEYDVLCHVGFGKAVNVIEMLAGSSWVNCSYDGNYGYISMRYLSYNKPVKPTARPTSRVTARPTSKPVTDESIYANFVDERYVASVKPSTPTGFVHMRWAPTKSAPVAKDYVNGQTLYVLKANANWCQVFDPDTMTFGYMMRSFINYTSPLGDGVIAGSDS